MSNQNITFSIPDMHCPSCPKLIKLTLSELDGVAQVNASLETKTVAVDFDSEKISTSVLINSITEIGYTASLK